MALAIASTECRFAPSQDWSSLATDSAVQDAYVAAALEWDGRFAAVGKGVTASYLTCDHVTVTAQGKPGNIARFTAASKESLHIGMLALIVEKRHLAWHWMAGALAEEAGAVNATANESEALAAAVVRLERIIEAYEEFDQQCRGCGGFLPWVRVSDFGFAKSQDGVSIPSLDNGQLAWSMLAASEALRTDYPVLAARYAAYAARMAQTGLTLYADAHGMIGGRVTIYNVSAEVAASNRKVSDYKLGDPWEGELMLFFPADHLKGLRANQDEHVEAG